MLKGGKRYMSGGNSCGKLTFTGIRTEEFAIPVTVQDICHHFVSLINVDSYCTGFVVYIFGLHCYIS